MVSTVNNDTSDQNYDRFAELKAFDDTKAGVKGLVDAGISTIPKMFIHPPDKTPLSSSLSPNPIPTIDLSQVCSLPRATQTTTSNEDYISVTKTDLNKHKTIVEEVRRAAETCGVFQAVNHGIPCRVMEEMLEGVRRFHELDSDAKKVFYTRDVSQKVNYNSNFDLYKAPAANWRDTFFCMMAPERPCPQDLPAPLREIVVQYADHVMRLGKKLFELLSEVLGLNPSYLNDIDCTESLMLLGHYYPPCPHPELTMGTTKHTDNDFITVLLQDHLGALQVMIDDQWVDVAPTPGALVINIGDLLQLITNDRFKSPMHRVLAKCKGPRVSVACFFGSSIHASTRTYGPIKELLSETNPPRYRETTIKEFTIYYINKGLDGTSASSFYRL